MATARKLMRYLVEHEEFHHAIDCMLIDCLRHSYIFVSGFFGPLVFLVGIMCTLSCCWIIFA